MDYITREKFSKAINAKFGVGQEIVNDFRVKFGDKAPLNEFILWLRGYKGNDHHEAYILSTSDKELTQALINYGANPHAYEDKALIYAAEDGDGNYQTGSVESLKVLLLYKPSLQAMENALNCTRKFSWSSNPETEALLEKHIQIAKEENAKEKGKRSKPVPKVTPRITMGPVVA